MQPPEPDQEKLAPLRILSLDGGGAKGFYTLGVLRELEAAVGPLHQFFPLMFGTSTGAIIAALLASGRDVQATLELYKAHVPAIMKQSAPAQRTAALRRLCHEVFGEIKFSDLKTRIGIVATQWDLEKPMIFKTSVEQAHGRKDTFIPGFGCTLAEAVEASCSAYPFFERRKLQIRDGEWVELADGGYCANNPTLYAIADAVRALKQEPTNLRVVSLGVGTYPEPRYGWYQRMIRKWPSVRLLQKTLNVNTASMDQLRVLLFRDVPTVRICETFSTPEMATDLMEHHLTKLDLLYQRGRQSYAQCEDDLRRLFH